mgnify:CR=1 FL=1
MKQKPKSLEKASDLEIEANCGFFGGHSFSANPGVQVCLWCTATRPAPTEDGDK